MDEPPLSWLQLKAALGQLEQLLEAASTMSAEDRQVRLILLLNLLETTLIQLPHVKPSGPVATGRDGLPERRGPVATAFSEFGWYHSIRPSSADQDESPGIADAVDDLAEILSDLDAAMYAEIRRGWIDGVWEAKFAYEHHLGSHLADLRSHLYRLRFFGP